MGCPEASSKRSMPHGIPRKGPEAGASPGSTFAPRIAPTPYDSKCLQTGRAPARKVRFMFEPGFQNPVSRTWVKPGFAVCVFFFYIVGVVVVVVVVVMRL